MRLKGLLRFFPNNRDLQLSRLNERNVNLSQFEQSFSLAKGLQRRDTLPWNTMHFDTASWSIKHGFKMAPFLNIYEAIKK